jgi:RNA polymerase sigma-70 factor (ECF subfamily)
MSAERPLSFELLYQDYSRRVYLWAYRLLGSPEAAEDATQDIFLRAWRYLPNFDRDKGNLTSWLYRMTVQVICNQRRSNPWHAALLSLEHLQWDVQDPEAADPQCRYEGNNEQLALALGALPQHARVALVLHASGYCEEEIALSVGRTSRTVRNWLTSGRAHLMKAVEGAR